MAWFSSHKLLPLLSGLLVLIATVGSSNCPSSELRNTLLKSVEKKNDVVCRCTPSTPEVGSTNGWEITCFNESSDGEKLEDSFNSSSDDYNQYQYYHLPTAFTVKYSSGNYVRIECDQDSPLFKPAMFQGFGVDEIDNFQLINCNIPSIPLNVIFHRTSRPLIAANSQFNVISKVKSIKLQTRTETKISANMLKTLFTGLESLEHLNIVNIVINSSLDRNNEMRNRGNTPRESFRFKRETSVTKLPDVTGRSIENPNDQMNSSSVSSSISRAVSKSESKSTTVLTDSLQTTTPSSLIFSSSSTDSTSPQSPSISSQTSPSLDEVKSTDTIENSNTEMSLEGSDLDSTSSNNADRNRRIQHSPGLSRNEDQGIDIRPIKTKKLNFNFGYFFPNLKSLHLENFLTDSNSIYLKEILTGLNNLERLSLHLNSLSVLPEKAFSFSLNLKTVYLIKNKIRILDPKSFLNLDNIEVLDLTNNQIVDLPSNLLKDLRNLKHLRLRNNKINSIPSNFFANNSQLKFIDFNSNPIVSIPPKFLLGLPNLDTLILSDCNLTSLSVNPGSLFQYSANLETIELRGNQLKNLTVPNLFGWNPKLKKLDISYNSIEELSSDIFNTNASKLEELNLYANELNQLQENQFFNLKRLRILKIGFNNFKEMYPSIFYPLTQLEELDLSNNNLIRINRERTQIPFGLGSNLRKVNLSLNNLTNFNDEFGTINWSLYYKFEELKLNKNQLNGRIRIPHFYSQRVLLDLSSNKINTILVNELILHEEAILISMEDSKDLKFNDFKTSASHIKVNIFNNPLKCDCELQPFLKYARNSPNQSGQRSHLNKIEFGIDSDEVTCSSPKELFNSPLYKLNLDDLLCPIFDQKMCPKECHCYYRGNNKQIVLDCDSKGLKEIPKEFIDFNKFRGFLDKSNYSMYNGYIFKLSNNQLTDIKGLKAIVSGVYSQNRELNLQLKSSKIKDSNISLELYLDNNSIEILPSLFQIPANNTANMSSSFEFIKVISLRNNKLQMIPPDFFESLSTDGHASSDGIKLYLGSNPYNCSSGKAGCLVRGFKSWLTLNYYSIRDISNITCSSQSYNMTSVQPLVEISDDILCPKINEAEEKALLLTLTVLCFILLVLLAIVSLLYINKQTVLAFIYIHFNPIFICLNFNEEDIDEDKLYDAFISYSSADRDVVMELIDKLEKPSETTNQSINYLQSQLGIPSVHEGSSDQIVPEIGYSDHKLNQSKISSNRNNDTEPIDYFRLCVHERDWLPGNLISWNIVNSVQNSRRTILIISKEFLSSIWFQVEFHTAYYQMLEDKIDRLIVILKGDLPPKSELDKDLVFLLTTKTYLTWGEKWFWEKLRYALPHKKAQFKKRKKEEQQLNNSTIKRNQNVKSQLGRTVFTNYPAHKASTPKSTSSTDKMKEYVDQTIANHFNLDESPITRSSDVQSNSASPLSSSNILNNSKNKYRVSLQVGSPKTPTHLDTGTIAVKSPAPSNPNDGKHGHVNQSFIVETET